MSGQLWKGADGVEPGGWSDGLEREASARARRRTAKVGLGVFLGVVSSLFLLFLLAFIVRSQVADWRPLTDPLAPLAQPWMLWVNTGLLLLASASLQWAKMSRSQAWTTLAFLLGGVFALAFLAGQLWVWQWLGARGYPVAGNPANSFFYLLTGLHGLHLAGGLVAWTLVARRMLRQGPSDSLRTGVELCAYYWHYLLGLWLLLFAVLTSTPETYQAIAAFCGLR
ncbi:cytochrome c oxidase subunit 3 [Metapseudomonas resinovorans]|uniref:Cytochrome c oxidase subunit III CoxO n=1 Tax=Metapseudomonas resinovorans NBRC 106553 TaxID=1245471 RepID=S6AEZ6_METRE|nr:cytochrome c oxidase subunit 3 [Pseudomonas resinovorans]BAN48397.1 cytochrome c oxidase subunit III CoxO [Pseudomonas resinovorans NBRC 106553]